MNNEQFSQKVYKEAPFEFLIGECDYELNDLEQLYSKQIYQLILKESVKLNEKEMTQFIKLNCKGE